MIKQLNQSDITVTPFNAIKEWNLKNVDSEDLILLEELVDGSPIPDTFVAVDYIDYTFGNIPIWNSSCNILVDQQDLDKVTFEHGKEEIGISKKFSINGPKNRNGSYKSLIYNKIYNTFYNEYNNPTQIFGMENFDFPLSKTNRYLTDEFRVFSIPNTIFGDKIVEGSVTFNDTNLDDIVHIFDDSRGNLIASKNLFSKSQELRPMKNIIIEGDETADHECPLPAGIPPVGNITIESMQL